jgi:small redox-active disulfide protein 2
MKSVKVLGTGCAKCKSTVQAIEETARAKGVAIDLAKVDQIAEIVTYGVMGLPAVVIDGKVVLAGRVPTRKEVETWLA